RIRQGMARLFSRLAALGMLLIAAPVLLITALWLKVGRRGPVLCRKEVVRLPAPPEEHRWRTFRLWSFLPGEERGKPAAGEAGCGWRGLLLGFLPALVNVVRGDLGLVGVPPRTRKEIDLLSADWKSLYLRSKAGIVTEATVSCDADPTEEELYAAEAFYAVAGSWRHDLKLLLRYLTRSLLGPARSK